MADNVLGLLFEINADPENALEALSKFRAAMGPGLDAVRSQFLGLGKASLESSVALAAAFNDMTGAVTGFGQTTVNLLRSVTESLLEQIDVAKLSALEYQAAENLKANATITARKNVAAVRTIEEIAEGIAALARLQFHEAALHFASAAEFGLITAARMGAFGSAISGQGGGRRGGGTSRGAVGVSGGGGRSASAGSTARAITRVAPTVGAGLAPAQSVETLQVRTLVVTNLAVANLIDGINAQVVNQDKFLMATRARQPTISGT